MRRWLEQLNFARLLTIFAVIFGIALGACGLTVLAANSVGGGNVLGMAVIELIVMILAAAGFVVVLLLLVLVRLLGLQKPYDPREVSLSNRTDQDGKS